MYAIRASFIGILAIGVGGASSLTLAQQVATTPAIRDVQPVAFPPHTANRRIALFAPSAAEYAQAVGDRAFVMERVTYRSDDLDVYAYLYRPVAPPKDKKLPVVVFNRGSYVRDDFSYEVLMLANRLAHQGYLVIAPMLRGSGGGRGHDEMGGADTKHDFPARAIAVWGAITDLGSFLAEDSPSRQIAHTIWPGFPGNEAEIVESRSAIRWPEKINIPVLLMNGGADSGVSPLHAIQLASALEKLRKRYELKIFYGEEHVSPGRARERDEDTVRWFRRFDDPSSTP